MVRDFGECVCEPGLGVDAILLGAAPLALHAIQRVKPMGKQLGLIDSSHLLGPVGAPHMSLMIDPRPDPRVVAAVDEALTDADGIPHLDKRLDRKVSR